MKTYICFYELKALDFFNPILKAQNRSLLRIPQTWQSACLAACIEFQCRFAESAPLKILDIYSA